MSVRTELPNPALDERLSPSSSDQADDGIDSPFMVILYNDDVHSIDEVIDQIGIATGYPAERCEGIALEAHTLGRAVAYAGSETKCDAVAGVLRRIRLQVETDRC